MTEKVRDESNIEASLEKIQHQLTDLQEQIKAIAAKSDASTNREKKDALSTLVQLPDDAEDQITWGYAGAYHAPSGHRSRRGSFWTNSVDEFLSRAPDAEIVNLGTILHKSYRSRCFKTVNRRQEIRYGFGKQQWYFRKRNGGNSGNVNRRGIGEAYGRQSHRTHK